MDDSALKPPRAEDGLLSGVAAAAQSLLTAANLDLAIARALETVGRALDTDRVCVIETHPHPQTEEALVSQRYQWVRDPALAKTGPGLQNLSLQGSLPRWHATLCAGGIIQGLVREFPPAERALLESMGVKSVLIVPIMMQERWLGFVCFDDCRRERVWSGGERAILQTLAACLGGAISRRQADQATKASIRKYRSLFESSRDGILITTLDGCIEDANRACLEMLGYSFEELSSLNYQSLTPVGWAKRDAEVVSSQVLTRGYSDEYEKEYTRHDGTVHPVSVRVWLVRDEQGQPSRMWRIVRDIAERKKMEESLRASERQLRTIVDKLPVGVWLTDAHGKVILCNPAGESIWGGVRISGIEQYGQYTGWWHATGRRIQPHEWAPVRALTRGETYVNEVVDIETVDGTRKTIAHSAIPVRDEASRIMGIVVINEDITDRKRAEARLRESDERHRRITQALSDYVYTVWVQDGRAVSTEHGAACEAVTGFTRDDFSNNPYLWLRMVVEEDRTAVLEQGRRILAGEPAGPIEHRIVRKDGQVRWVRNTPVPHRDAQGKLLYFDGVIQDITDRRQAEDSLRLAQFAMDHCAIPVFWIGPQGRFSYVNEAAVRSLGYPREQLTYLGAPDIDPDFTVGRWPAHWAELKAAKSLRFETRHRAQDGRVFPVEVTANYMEFGGKEYNFAFAVDISERKRAEAASLESETKYRIVADNTFDWEFWSSPEGRFLYVSPSCRRITGHGPEEFMADPGLLARLINPEDRPRFESHRCDVLERKVAGEVEFRIVRPDGAVRWIGHVCQPICDKDGRFLGTRGSNRDITERRLAEQSLRFIQFSVDNCSIPAYRLDGEGRILYANEAASRSLGYSREDLLKMRLAELDPRWSAEGWARFWADLKERRSLVLESCQRAQDGRVFPTEVTSSYLEHDGKECCFSFVQDITLRKSAEEAQGS